MEDLLEGLFDEKILKIIRFFILNKEKEFYLQEIAREANVPIATVFRNVRKLKDLGIIEEIAIKKFKLYRCANNDKAAFLERFLKGAKRVLEEFASRVGSLGNVEEVLLYGKDMPDKANVIIIGKGVDSNEVKRICSEFKERDNMTVTPLILEREQYEQINKMGLYSEQKRVIFSSR
jgi:predicted transcriptional regulator